MIISRALFQRLIQSKKRATEGLFPELVKRLIRESLNNNVYTHFPSNDDIFTPGWDGFIYNNQIDHKYVPKGDSIYEFGANTDSGKGISKIKSDYDKRKTDSTFDEKNKYSYIALTTSVLNSTSKQKFSNDANKEKVFKNVIVLDAIDITDWLEEHIDICLWFLEQYGEKLDDYDITSLESEWGRLSACTTPYLPHSLFTVGNQRNALRLIESIQDKTNKIITISSKYYGRDFAFSFGIATLFSCNYQDLKERVIVVNSQAGMNYISAFCEGKIVLVNYNCFDDRFASNLNNTYVFFDTLFDGDIELDLIEQREFEAEIEKLGYSSSDSYRISYTVDYNVLALRRLLTKIPTLKIPLWSKNNDKNELIPLLLLGEIDMSYKGDIEFLSAIIGDNVDSYTEKLNIWSEMNQSPILKYEGIYRICSRKECFDFLQIDIFSSKLKRLEDFFLDVMSDVNDRIDADDRVLTNGSTYKWRRRLLENIIDGFIILCGKSKRNQSHFDLLIDHVFEKLPENYKLSLTISPLFYRLAEISPKSFIKYIEKSINDDKENFIALINFKDKYSYTKNQFLHYVINALENILKLEEFSLEGFTVVLDIYYHICDDDYVLEEILKLLSPLSSMERIISVPLSKKTDYFFKYIGNKDFNKTFTIVNKIYENDNRSVMIGVTHSYREYPNDKIVVTYSEIFDLRSKAFNWLIENNTDANSLIKTLKDILHNIHYNPFDMIKNQLESIQTKIVNENDDTKALVCLELMKTREDILRFKEWEKLKVYVPIFDSMISKLSPLEDYYRYKYLFIDEEYPLDNPPSFDDVKWFEKTHNQRRDTQEKHLKLLIKKHGHGIIERIINDCENNAFSIWELIYKYSDNHIKDVDQIIEKGLSTALRIMLRLLSNDEMKLVQNNYGNLSLFVKNLPYRQDIIDWIDGKEKEKEYWENQLPDFNNSSIDESIFEKFLQFAPLQLVSTFAYSKEIDYSHGIKLLTALGDNLESESIRKNSHEIYGIQKLVSKMDKMYYTSELFLCEFRLLPLLKSGIEDYPIGIKKYFWDNPKELGNLLISLYEQRDTLPNGSMGQKLLFEANISLGSGCYIPIDYLVSQRDKIRKWCEDVISCAINKELPVRLLLKSAIINTLTCCPKNSNESIWPIREIADVLEEFSLCDYDDKIEVSRIFYCGYANRRGVRSVENGTKELVMSQEFKKYQDFYHFSHPITAKALDFISNAYLDESEMDKKQSVLGRN